MTVTWTLLDLAGSVALLLWGVHMVQTGIQRAFGPALHRGLSRALRSRLHAFAAGLGVTAVLQSSTATGLMLAGFAASGVVDLVPALAAMLGANVGTTLIVQVLSFDVAAASPALILLGVILFRRPDANRARDLGRAAIGLGLMLLALHQIVTVITPFEDAPSLRMVLGGIATEPAVDLLLAAALAWAAHSSVVVVLVAMSLAARGVVPPAAAFALVLGANLGTAVNPLLEGAHGDDPRARRLPAGNLLIRLLGCAVALALLGPVGRLMVVLEPDNARAVADFHTAFNLVLALVFLPLLAPYAALLRRLLPARVVADDPARPRYLDRAALPTPPVALAGAAREALRMADALEALLQGAADSLGAPERRRIAEARRRDDVIDRLNAAIKAYLSALDPETMTEDDHQRLSEILTFATNLEAAGDVIDRNVMGHLQRRLKRGTPLPETEREEGQRLLARLTANVRSAAAVFIAGDLRAARLLAAEKEAFRTLEAAATAAHFQALRASRGSPETRQLHLDLLRDLQRANGHIVAAAAYPVLRGQGELLASRLRPEA
ncbi:MAG: Na/Pi cotransporter family protein [Proteobacteria bacterium]|nr:Na/Pi cotransporter family protein [Pseudomonadota bacterium]